MPDVRVMTSLSMNTERSRKMTSRAGEAGLPEGTSGAALRCALGTEYWLDRGSLRRRLDPAMHSPLRRLCMPRNKEARCSGAALVPSPQLACQKGEVDAIMVLQICCTAASGSCAQWVYAKVGSKYIRSRSNGSTTPLLSRMRTGELGCEDNTTLS